MQGGSTGIILRYSGHQKIFYIDTFLQPSEYTLMYRMPSGKKIAPDPFKVPIAMDPDAGELQPVPQKNKLINSMIIYITNKIQDLAMYYLKKPGFFANDRKRKFAIGIRNQCIRIRLKFSAG